MKRRIRWISCTWRGAKACAILKWRYACAHMRVTVVVLDRTNCKMLHNLCTLSLWCSRSLLQHSAPSSISPRPCAPSLCSIAFEETRCAQSLPLFFFSSSPFLPQNYSSSSPFIHVPPRWLTYLEPSSCFLSCFLSALLLFKEGSWFVFRMV